MSETSESAPATSVQSEIPPFTEPRSIGETRLLHLLSNASAESDVWLGERPDGRLVAVKIYRRGRAPGLIDSQLKQELQHPHLLSVLEAGEIRQQYYEISPYIPTGTLSNWLRERGRISESEAEIVLRQLASALDYLHRQHVLHRDVKPGNIFIRSTKPLDLALADYGVARLGSGQTLLTTTVGTIAYSAPEAVTGLQSEASDFWSLGMILLEALTGRHPFANLDLKQQLYRVASGQVEIPVGLSSRWQSLLRGLLTSDYTTRWHKQQTDAWCENQPVPSSAPISTRRAVPSERPSRGPAQLERAPEQIELTPDEWLTLIRDTVRRSIFPFFWLPFVLGGWAHNGMVTAAAWAALILLPLLRQLLPSNREELKRELRVERELDRLPRSERRRIRQLVREWMRNLDDED
ncbi:MAG: serine/threonine-protein kinase [Verrucomicrobia bacterium]|nr:serine/threonine-protein kinase [Verrucomicrobiota bacterium]